MISLQSSAQVEALRPDSCFQDWGLEKGRIGRVKERKDRAKGRKVSKVSCSLTSQGALASCSCQDSKDKRVPVAAAGSGPSPGNGP